MTGAARQASGQRVARDVLMQIVVRVANLALGVVVTALLARVLGVVNYGQLATILVAFGLVGYLTDFGVEGVVVREVSRAPEREEEWLGAMLQLRLLALIPSLLVSLGAVVLLQRNTQMLTAGLILLAGLPFNVLGVLGVVFQLRVNNLIPMMVLTLKSVLLAVAVGLIFWRGGGLIAWAIALTLTGAIGSSITAFAAMRVTGGLPKLSFVRAKSLLLTAIPLGVGTLLIVFYAQIDQVLVFKLAGSRPAGLYGAVYNVLNQASFVPISLLTTLSPIIAASWPDQRERMFRAVRMAAEFLTISSLGALAFVIVAATPLVRLFFGGHFAASAPALPVLGGAFVFICFGYLNGTLLLVLGLQRHMIPIGLAGLVFNVAGNFILIPAVGFMGAAWMTLATEILVFSWGAALVLRELDLRRPGIGRIGRTVVAAGLLVAGLSALRLVSDSLLLLVPAACLCYPALLFGLRALTLDDLRVLLGRPTFA